MTEPDAQPAQPGYGGEARAAVLTVLALVLTAGPVGLLWATVAPPVQAVVTADGATRLAEPTGDGFIAVDGVFLALVALAGLVSGVVAWRVAGRTPRLGVVLGLAVGGLLAAELARRTGQLVGADAAQAAVDAGREGVVALPIRLRAEAARAGWPATALTVHLLQQLVSAPEVSAPEVSSG